VLYDDLATQQSSFVSVNTFKEFYEPVYRRLADEIHSLGCEFHLHSCGKIDLLIPSLIEWGVDAIELDSPRMCGYPALAPFRGRIMFWGDVNIQTIYPNGTPADVEREVWHMVRNLGTPSGGFGAYLYPQPHHIRVPAANIRAFKSGLRKYGNYSRIPPGWWSAPVPAEWKDDVVPTLPTEN
jgi:uroporphyrinogen decarboxylase